MKNSTNKIFNTLIFILTTTIIGCDTTPQEIFQHIFQKDEYYHLATNNRSLLKTNDTLVYINNTSHLDTIVVLNKIVGQYLDPKGGMCKSPYRYYDIELLYMHKKNDKKHLQYDLCHSLKGVTKFGYCANGYRCDKAIVILTMARRDNKNLCDTYISWYGYDFQHTDSNIDSKTIQSKKYNDILNFTISDIVQGDSINKVYYSIKNGIVQIDLADGNKLELKQK